MGAASAVTLSVMNLARANAQGAAAPEATTHGTMVDVPFEKRNPRIAFIGVGHRGTSLLNNLLAAGAQIVALCDVNPEAADHAASLVVAAGQPKPPLFTDGPYAFETMLAKDDHRPGHRRHSLELALRDGRRRHEARQGCVP